MTSKGISELDDARADALKGFELKQVPASATDQWSISDGALKHSSDGFFNVVGVKFAPSGDELVMLYQPQAAITGVISARVNGERRFLIHARAEPGNVDEVQFGPTIQSTPANFLKFHGGSTAPYFGPFMTHDAMVSLREDTTQLDLGNRYLFKTKRSILLEAALEFEPKPSFVWATREQIYDAIRKPTFLNTELRSLFAVIRWSADDDDGELTPRSEPVRRSLAAPVRADAIGGVLFDLGNTAPHRSSFMPIQDMKNWQVGEFGLSEIEPAQRFAVNFYEVSASFREVGHWVQPLVNSASEGHVVLACRERDGFLEFFVRPLSEPGLASGKALAPSYLRYPGEVGGPPSWLAPHLAAPWAETRDSDEGGRFYRDASLVQIVRCDDLGEEPPAETGHWLRLSELKQFLRSSNACTIQLRYASSNLLSLT